MTDDPVLLSQLIVRHVTQEDLQALEWDGEYAHFRRLYADVFLQSVSGRTIMWVAELPKEGIVGQVFVSLNSHRPELSDGVSRAYIYGFRIKPAYRNRGVGAHMLRFVEEDLLKRGFGHATLNVGQENHQARKLYERMGYQIVAPDPGRWFFIDHLGQRVEVHEPAWRMEKRL